MSSSVSTNYRELSPEEIPAIAAACADAWKSPEIPARQYQIVKPELESYRKGGTCPPFDALIRCMNRLPEEMKWPDAKLLDVGASGGYYREVLRQNSFWCDYTACDFNPAFKVLAEQLYPGIEFDIADARELPYHDDSFSVVLTSATIMHVADWMHAISEAVRVARHYVIFHRTPILVHRPTAAFVKSGYGIEMLEWHFNEAEFMRVLGDLNLHVKYMVEVFFDASEGFGHRSYLVEKEETLFHHPV